MMSFLQNSLFNELFQFSFTHSQIYPSSQKQKTPWVWGFNYPFMQLITTDYKVYHLVIQNNLQISSHLIYF